jgi:hypothetical protein
MTCFICSVALADKKKKGCKFCEFRKSRKDGSYYCKLEEFGRPYTGRKINDPFAYTIKQCELCDINKICRKPQKLKAGLNKQLRKEAAKI